MTENHEHRVSLREAVRQVGIAIYAADWIGSLTERERWLIAEYVENPHNLAPQSLYPSSIDPGNVRIVYTDGSGRDYNRLRRDSPIWQEVDLALDRRKWRQAQYDRVYQWLTGRGFNCQADTLDALEFARAFSEAFGATTHGRRKLIAPRVPRTALTAALQKKLREFAEAEKSEYGTYPPIAAGASGRKCYRDWASENDVSRNSVEAYVRENQLTNRTGAPKKVTR